MPSKYVHLHIHSMLENRIGGVMVSMLASSVVDRGFIGGVMGSMLSSSVVDRGAERSSLSEKQTTGPGLLKDSPYSIS